jgi:hypothetical protein
MDNGKINSSSAWLYLASCSFTKAQGRYFPDLSEEISARLMHSYSVDKHSLQGISQNRPQDQQAVPAVDSVKMGGCMDRCA